MSTQVTITGEAKIRSLTGVLTGTAGIVSSLPINLANGIPQLDVNGKILVSQLPNSVMEFKGTWNAATNTPTLANGTGNTGDVWLCNVAGTVNFGAGPVVFAVGDYAVYDGATWQKSGGAVGTVTSIATSSPITGGPITNTGTIGITKATSSVDGYLSNVDWNTFNGKQDSLTFYSPLLKSGVSVTLPQATALVDGFLDSADWTIFNNKLSSVGLSMPVAFTVANSPLTANGTIEVTGAGTASQYIRGDGQLATMPSGGGGGGSSVYYYLNGSIAASVATYKQMSNTAVVGTGTNFNLVGNGLISQFLTDVGNPNKTTIPSGAWNFEMFFSMSSSGGTQKFYVELLKYDGSTFTSIASTSANPEAITGGTTTDLYITSMAVPETVLLTTDRLAVRVYIVDNSGGRTATLHTEDSNLCQITTTFTAGINSLNGLTTNTQFLSVGTGGTDFNISSLVDTHTFNLPTANGTKRGALSSADWTTFNNKLSTSTAAATYVPYTGATNHLNLGANSLYSTNIINYKNITIEGNGSLTGSLVIKTSTSGYTYGGTGYMSITSNATKYLNVVFQDSISSPIIQANLGFDIMTESRTYTLPNASGTLALISDLDSYVTLATAQTISGQKNFTNTTNMTTILASGSINASSASLTNGIVLPHSGSRITSSGSTSISVSGTNGIAVGFPSGQLSSLAFPTASSNTYTYPNATGTLALTSDIPSLTGYVQGTGTTNYLPKFTGASTIGNSILQEGTNAIGLGVTPSAWYSGYVALEMGSGSLVYPANGSNTQLWNNLYVNAAGNVTYKSTGIGGLFSLGGGGNTAIWYSAPSGTSGTTASLTQAMILFANGNLALNTTTDAGYKLDVNGTGRFVNNGISTAFGDATSFVLNSVKSTLTASQTVAILIGKANSLNNQMTLLYNHVSDGSTSNYLGLGFYGQDNLFKLYATGEATFSSSIGIATSTGTGLTYYLTPSGWNGAKHRFGVPTSGDASILSFNWNGSARDYAGYGSSVIGLSDGTITFGIGSGANPTTRLTIASTGAATFSNSVTATSFFESSDSRLKTLIQDNYQTKGIASITPKLYTKNGKVELGYYAQDFVGILDSAVSKGSDDMLSLSYREVLVAKVYALEQEIKELKAKMN